MQNLLTSVFGDSSSQPDQWIIFLPLFSYPSKQVSSICLGDRRRLSSVCDNNRHLHVKLPGVFVAEIWTACSPCCSDNFYTTTSNNNKNKSFNLLNENKSYFNRSKNLPVQEVPLESTPFPSLHSVHTSLLAEHFAQSATAHATINKYNINPHIQCPHIFLLLPLLIIQKVLFSITISTSANNVTIYWHPSFFNPQCGQFCVTHLPRWINIPTLAR